MLSQSGGDAAAIPGPEEPAHPNPPTSPADETASYPAPPTPVFAAPGGARPRPYTPASYGAPGDPAPSYQAPPAHPAAPSIGEPPAYPPAPFDSAPDPYAPPPRPRSRGLAVTALVLGIVAALLGWLPGAGMLVGLVAVGFGIAALVRRQSKPASVTGLVLGSLGFVSSTVIAVIAVVVGLSAPAFVPGEAFALPTPSEQTAQTDEQSAAPEPSAAGVDLAGFSEQDADAFAALVADPGAHYGEQIVLFGEVQQYDAMTGDCQLFMTVDQEQQATWEGYEEWTLAWAASSEEADTTCDEFADVRGYSHVKVWATVLGVSTVDFEDGADDVLTLDIHYVEQLPILQ